MVENCNWKTHPFSAESTTVALLHLVNTLSHCALIIFEKVCLQNFTLIANGRRHKFTSLLVLVITSNHSKNASKLINTRYSTTQAKIVAHFVVRYAIYHIVTVYFIIFACILHSLISIFMSPDQSGFKNIRLQCRVATFILFQVRPRITSHSIFSEKFVLVFGRIFWLLSSVHESISSLENETLWHIKCMWVSWQVQTKLTYLYFWNLWNLHTQNGIKKE